ncbi:hypothetical protein B0J17DRAFT_773283 [Rhizoctonia solani]|nr:hypothetical protein B0J17DRAFT_773283 [Rhizoctonia solani]
MKFLGAFTLAVLLASVNGAELARQCTSLEVRREWRAFSKTERKACINAVNCPNKTPSNGKLRPLIDTQSISDPAFHIALVNKSVTCYDDLVYAQMNLNLVIHRTGLFLPWHRYVTMIHGILVFAIRVTNYCYTAYTYTNEQIFSAASVVMKELYHIGHEKKIRRIFLVAKFGTLILKRDWEASAIMKSSNDYTIHTGALKIDISYPTPHKLHRHYIPQPFTNSTVTAVSTFTPAEVQKLLTTPDGNFTQFQGYLEAPIGMHGAVHIMMGGDMGTRCPLGSEGTIYCLVQRTPTFSANEPMCHLHHGNVDRLWWLWQEKNVINKNAFHGGSVQNKSSLDIYPNGQPPWLSTTSPVPSAGLWNTYTIGETMDTRSWPWCYVYDQ